VKKTNFKVARQRNSDRVHSIFLCILQADAKKSEKRTQFFLLFSKSGTFERHFSATLTPVGATDAARQK